MKQYQALLLIGLFAAGCATIGFDSTDDTTKPVADPGGPTVVEEEAPRDRDEPASFVLDAAEVTSEEFTFESNGEKLEGELVRPTDSSTARPGVVIAHDSGPLSRDGIMRGAFGVQLPVEVAVYRTLAEYLASRGFVVLIWDKRTCITGSQPWCNYPRTFIEGHADKMGDVLVADLKAAIVALRADPSTSEIVHVIGHGQGAEVALNVADASPASIVLAAPNTQSLDAMVLTQIERSIEALRARTQAESNAETDQMVKQLELLEARHEKLTKAFEAIRKGEGDETAGLSAEAWRNLIELHTTAIDATPNVPTLVIEAGMDLDVDEESRVQAIDGWKRAGAEVVSFDDVTRPLVSVAREDDPTSVSNQVTAKLAEFLIDATAR